MSRIKPVKMPTFQRESGVNYSKFAFRAAVSAGMLSVGSFLVEFVPHTFLIEKYKNVVQMYRLGQGVPLNENVDKLFERVLDDLKIDEKNRKYYEPFTVTGFEVFHAGVASGYCKAIIGIPINYTYTNRLSVDPSEIRVGYDQEPLNVYHPAAENLLNSLVLSEKAQKFGIAREILMSQKDLPLYRSLESAFTVMSTSGMIPVIRSKLNLQARPASLSVITYGVTVIFAFTTWFQIRDSINTYFEKAVDKELAALGPEYVEGGKEFYEKILVRNIALRTLLGAQGPKTYNRDGDEVIFIRQKRTPVTYRKKFFSEYIFENVAQEAA